jgi:uncharacterized protein YjbI with pentapeptide repeats
MQDLGSSGIHQRCYRVVVVEEKGKQAAREEHGRKPWTLREFGGKTVWDWLDLLLVPLVLGIVAAGLTAWFNAQQEARQNDIEEQRARAERELAEQRAEDEVLQTYLDQMGTLLIEKDLRGSKEGSEVRTLARARTLTATGRLSAGRKRVLIRFLYEANLIDRTHPIIALDGANLQDINLRGVNLSGGPFLLETHLGRDGRISIGGPKSKLSIGSDGVDLSGADISRAKLANAVLIGADLSGVRLSYANLRHALIGSTNSRSTDLTGAFLENADLTGAFLDNTDLSGAILVRSHLRNSYLTESILRDTNFSGTDLSNAYLLGSDLRACLVRFTLPSPAASVSREL